MYKALVIFLLIGLGIGIALWDVIAPPAGTPQKVAAEQYKDAPDVTLLGLNGESIPLSDFKGKTVFLNIWATWCTPCVVEIPQLLELAEREDIVMIALSVDKDAKSIESFLKKLPQDSQERLQADNVIIAHDTDLSVSMKTFGSKFYPETYVISPDGKILKKIEGIVDWLGADIKGLIAQSNAR